MQAFLLPSVLCRFAAEADKLLLFECFVLHQPNSVNIYQSAAIHINGDTISKGPTVGTLLAQQSQL